MRPKDPCDTIFAEAASRVLGTDVSPEIMWKACREMVAAGLLTPDQESLATAEIGPFRLASKLDAEHYVKIFCRTVISVASRIVLEGRFPDFKWEDVFAISAEILCTLADNTCVITSDVEWKVLILIKLESKRGNNLNLRQLVLELAEEFPSNQIESAVRRLKNHPIGTTQKTMSLIGVSDDGSLYALV